MMITKAIPVAAPGDLAKVAVMRPNPTLHRAKIDVITNAKARLAASPLGR